MLKSLGCPLCLCAEKLQRLIGKAAICGARLVSRQVRAHLWHRDLETALQLGFKPTTSEDLHVVR